MNHDTFSDRAPLERRLAAWMTDEVNGPAPMHELDRILNATSRMRPQPRWLALLKEPQMNTRSEGQPRIAVGLPARGVALVIILVALALVTGLVAIGAGAFRANPAPPLPLSVLSWKASGPGQDFTPAHNLAIDPQGRIWDADPTNDRFAITSPTGAFLEYWGSFGTADGRFILQRANGDGYGSIAFEPDGSFFVLDVGNFRVQQFAADRSFVRTWGAQGNSPGNYLDPTGIAVGPDGTLWVLDDGRGVIESYDRNGTVLGSIPMPGPVRVGPNTTNGMAIDHDGNLYITQIEAHRVAKVSPTGKLLTVFGYSGPGKFSEQPTQMAIDAQGHLFVTQGPERGAAPGVLIFAADGGYIAGFGFLGSGDSQLNFPDGIALDGKGNLFISDAGATAGGSLKAFKINVP
jgi:sugar lactone lactonase YvrE